MSSMSYSLVTRKCTYVIDEFTKVQRLRELKEYLKRQKCPGQLHCTYAICPTIELDKNDLHDIYTSARQHQLENTITNN